MTIREENLVKLLKEARRAVRSLQFLLEDYEDYVGMASCSELMRDIDREIANETVTKV